MYPTTNKLAAKQLYSAFCVKIKYVHFRKTNASTSLDGTKNKK